MPSSTSTASKRRRPPRLTRENFIVRTSERSKFRCRQAWWWSYHEHWSPFKKSIPLEFGDLIHQSLARWYIPESIRVRKRGVHPVKTYLKIYDWLDETGGGFNVRVEEDDKWVAARDLGEEMLTNYIDKWGKDERYVLIYPEMPFSLPIYDGDRLVGTYAGASDALAWDLEHQCYILFEHKTAASVNTDHLFIDDQAGSYWSIVPMWLRDNGVLKDDDDLGYMLYNYLRKAKRDSRPQNEAGQYLNKPTKAEQAEFGMKYPGSPSKVQPPPLFVRKRVDRGEYDRAMVYQRIIDQMDDIYAAHTGALKIYKQPSKDCAWCEFKDPCEMHEIGADYKDLLKLTFGKWDPYAQHEVGLPPVKVKVRGRA